MTAFLTVFYLTLIDYNFSQTYFEVYQNPVFKPFLKYLKKNSQKKKTA